MLDRTATVQGETPLGGISDVQHARRDLFLMSDVNSGWERAVRADTPRETASRKNVKNS